MSWLSLLLPQKFECLFFPLLVFREYESQLINMCTGCVTRQYSSPLLCLRGLPVPFSPPFIRLSPSLGLLFCEPTFLLSAPHQQHSEISPRQSRTLPFPASVLPLSYPHQLREGCLPILISSPPHDCPICAHWLSRSGFGHHCLAFSCLGNVLRV